MVCRPVLAGERFEVVVVGGGINGVAIARECVRAGRRTLLLEQNDFASGTTSRSTRIIHGGLRYLQYAEVGLVRQSLLERERLLRERPHLVRPMRFVLALNDQSRHNIMQIRAGLWLYRKLAGHAQRVADHCSLYDLEKRLDAGQVWNLFDYDDAQCEFPERLVSEWLTEAARAGAVVRNYARLLDIVQLDGRVRGIVFRDRLTQEECSVECRWVVNATGPWVDQVCAEASMATGGPLVGGVRGSHVVLPRFPGAPQNALYTQASDGRAIFVIPWNGQILLGTTEIPDRGDPANTQPSTAEIDYLIGSLNRILPNAHVSRADIHYAFAGVRPLPFVKNAAPSAVTRKSILWDHKHDGISGMISVIGGKLTTAASLARKCVRAMGMRPEPQTEVTVAPGNASGIEIALQEWANTVAARRGLNASAAKQIAAWHGPRALSIVRLAGMDPLMRAPLCPHTEHIVAEAVDAFRYEYAVTLGDVLLRRVPVAWGACWSSHCTQTAAKAIGTALGWSAEETAWQCESAETERNGFLRKPAGGMPRSSAPADRAA